MSAYTLYKRNLNENQSYKVTYRETGHKFAKLEIMGQFLQTAAMRYDAEKRKRILCSLLSK